MRHHPEIPPQLIVGGSAATGVVTAIALARKNEVGRFRKAVYLVRQPALQVGATLMVVYPQYLAQQCGLRTPGAEGRSNWTCYCIAQDIFQGKHNDVLG